MTPLPEALRAAVDGHGPPVLLIHATAADLSTWSQARPVLRQRLRLILYNRRGTGRSPLPPGSQGLSIPEHARDAAALLERHAPGERAFVCGSSFGGAVALELARTRPELLWGAVLMEPPVADTDEGVAEIAAALEALDEVAAKEGGGAAAERFLRMVLGDAAWERILPAYQERARAMWPQIRQDSAALATYPVGYARLSEVKVPVLLLRGERSVERYRRTLVALERALPNARLEVIPGAGHMMQVEASADFSARLIRFIEEVRGGTWRR